MFENFRKFRKPININDEILEEWKIELEYYYGLELNKEIINNAFYFVIGQLSINNENSFFPFIDENGNVKNYVSTLKRELLIEAISILHTGFLFPKNNCKREYEVFYIENFKKLSSLNNT